MKELLIDIFYIKPHIHQLLSLKHSGHHADINNMKKANRRKHPRVDLFNPISYSGIDSDGNILVQNIAVALNASNNGIMIESYNEIKSQKIRLRFTNYDQKTIETTGKVIHCTRKNTGIYQIGVRLLGTDYGNMQFVMQLVRFYELKKEKSSPAVVYNDENSQSPAHDILLL